MRTRELRHFSEGSICRRDLCMSLCSATSRNRHAKRDVIHLDQRIIHCGNRRLWEIKHDEVQQCL